MKVLDLACSQHHVFEGWFASEDDFQSQHARGLVACPLCGDTRVHKKLSAPRLNLSTVQGDKAVATLDPRASDASASTSATSASPASQDVASLAPAQMQAALLKMMRHVVANTDNVGERFAEEARKMHYGEAAQRNIRGHASPAETEALLDEGIAVMPLPLPDALKEPLQ